MHDSEFEKQVQQKMQELRFPPRADIWARVQADVRRKKGRRPVLWLVLLCGLLTGAAWLFYTGMDDGDKTVGAQTSSGGNKEGGGDKKVGAQDGDEVDGTVGVDGTGDTGDTGGADGADGSGKGVDPERANSQPDNTANGQPVNADNNTITNTATQPNNQAKAQPSNVVAKRPDNTTDKQSVNASNGQPIKVANKQPTNPANRQPNNTNTNTSTLSDNRANRQPINAISSRPENTANAKQNNTTTNTSTQPVNQASKQPNNIPNNNNIINTQPDNTANTQPGKLPGKDIQQSNQLSNKDSAQSNQLSGKDAPRLNNKSAKQKDTLTSDTKDPLKAKPFGAKAPATPNRKQQWGFTAGAGVSDLGSRVFQSAVVADFAYAGGSPPIGPSMPPLRKPSVVKAGVAFHAGGYVSRPVSKKLRVKLGLNYEFYSNNINVGSYVDSSKSINQGRALLMVDAFYESGNTTTYTNGYHFISLPANLQWQLNKSEKHGLVWENGFTLSGLVHTNALHYDGISSSYYKDHSLFNRVQLSVSSSLLLNIASGKQFQLSVGPHVQYGITNLVRDNGTTNSHMRYAGLKMVTTSNKK